MRKRKPLKTRIHIDLDLTRPQMKILKRKCAATDLTPEQYFKVCLENAILEEKYGPYAKVVTEGGA